MAAGAEGKTRAVLTARPAMPDLHLHGWLHVKKNIRDFRCCSPDAAAKGRLGLLKAQAKESRKKWLSWLGLARGPASTFFPSFEDLQVSSYCAF